MHADCNFAKKKMKLIFLQDVGEDISQLHEIANVGRVMFP